MEGSVTVSIVDAASRQLPASTSLVYEVHNDGPVPVWMVDDRWLVWSRDEEHIELGYFRARLSPGAEAFGYFSPEVVALPAGRSLVRTVELEWPLRLSLLWNRESIVAPPPGRYLFTVRIGFGTAPEPEEPQPGEPIDASVLRWQQQAVSAPAAAVIPPYDRS